MTERFLPDATTAEALLSQAEDQFAQVALELGEAARRAVEGEPGAAKLAAQAARELRDAFRILMSERERVDKLRTLIGGIAGALVLDFDAVKTGVERGAPAIYGWTAAFGIMVTVIWLYLELLRMFAIARD